MLSAAALYHSTAILLPDGRVLSMGSNPRAKMIEKSIEIFSPPYLFRGERPVISRNPDFAAPKAKLVIELDESQHLQSQRALVITFRMKMSIWSFSNAVE